MNRRYRTALPLIGVCALVLLPRFAQADDPAPVVPPLYQRIVMLGASATSGFHESEPLGGPKTPQYHFANYIEAALIGTHELVTTQATSLLFLQPEDTMKKQVTATLNAKPTLVIGIDAMFWFCYGAGLSEEQRATRFEAGLKELERIDVPLIVGDIPDATQAVGGILSKAELPEPRTIERCNERLTAWAAGRKNVSVFPIARVMTSAAANEQVILAGHTWEAGKSSALIRSDRLHPSRHALAALAIAMLDAVGPSLEMCRDLETVYAAAIARSGPMPKTE